MSQVENSSFVASPPHSSCLSPVQCIASPSRRAPAIPFVPPACPHSFFPPATRKSGIVRPTEKRLGLRKRCREGRGACRSTSS